MSLGLFMVIRVTRIENYVIDGYFETIRFKNNQNGPSKIKGPAIINRRAFAHALFLSVLAAKDRNLANPSTLDFVLHWNN